MSFDKLTPNQKIQAVNIDCMRHHRFALLAGVICMGNSEVRDNVPTALTDGKNKYYGAKFIDGFTRKQPMLFEVTPDKKIAWTFKDFTTFGNSLPVALVFEP